MSKAEDRLLNKKLYSSVWLVALSKKKTVVLNHEASPYCMLDAKGTCKRNFKCKLKDSKRNSFKMKVNEYQQDGKSWLCGYLEALSEKVTSKMPLKGQWIFYRQKCGRGILGKGSSMSKRMEVLEDYNVTCGG